MELFVLPMSWKHFLGGGGGKTKCWMNTPSSGSPPPCNVFPHWECQWPTPSIFPATVALWILAFQNCLYALLWGLGLTVAVYRSHCLTHKLVLATSVKTGVNIKFITIFSVNNFFPCRTSGGGGGVVILNFLILLRYVIYYITLQIYFGYNLICISASSVPMHYFYLLQLFPPDETSSGGTYDKRVLT